MNDKLLIITRIKKTINKIDKITENFSRNENTLRDNIKKTMYNLLEESYMANIVELNNRKFYQQKILIKIKMLDFYFNLAYEKKLITRKQFELVGNNLMDIFVMTRAWIKSGINEESE